MKNRIRITVLALVLILASILIYLNYTKRNDSNLLNGTLVDKSSLNKTIKSELKTERIAPEISPLADSLNSQSSTAEQDLRIVSEMLFVYRSNFPAKGNPVGNNAEITSVLAGNNKLSLILISPNHPAINASGELCDRWGTPYFFHAESGFKMKIRSAGPDKKMWTNDDLEYEP